MPQFQKGNAGKAKGTKNLKQFSLTYWFNLIVENYDKLSPYQRSEIALSCWKTLINKSKALPTAPEDSALNAEEAMKTLKEIETNSYKSSGESKA